MSLLWGPGSLKHTSIFVLWGPCRNRLASQIGSQPTNCWYCMWNANQRRPCRCLKIMHVSCLHNGAWEHVSVNTKHSFVCLTAARGVDAFSALLMGALTLSPAVHWRTAAPLPLLAPRVTSHAAFRPRPPFQPLALHWMHRERKREKEMDVDNERQMKDGWRWTEEDFKRHGEIRINWSRFLERKKTGCEETER